MTKINRLVCQGFKSFGKRVELQFGNTFNCILGPNGSGKSNVIDAICFVLGKSSSKSLRAEKAANLIYNGGKAKQPAKQGEVSIFFDNEKNTFPTEDKEVKITRIVRKDGSSVYKINDQVRTRTQVLDLLSLSKINPDGYNIILQGDIVRLVEMSTVDRRLVFEEIAGISIYEEKKQKALLELEKVEKKIDEADIILKERGAYLKELRSDRDQALKFKDLNDKIRSNKASYLKLQMNGKEQEVLQIDQRVAKHMAEVSRYRNEIAQLQAQSRVKLAEIEKITKEIEVKGEKDQVQFQKELEVLRIQIATNKTKMASHRQEIGRMRQRNEQLAANRADLQKKIDTLTEEKQAFERQRQQIEHEIVELDAKIAAFKKKHNIDQATAELDREVEEIDRSSEEMQNAINRLREEQQDLLRRRDRAELETRVMDEKISKVSEVAKQHKEELDTLNSKRSAFKQITIELNKVLTEGSRLSVDMNDIKGRLQAAHENLSRLQAKNVGIRERVQSNQAVQKILENRKQLGGIHGTVAELADVPSKYAPALEIAAGHRINSIVVDTDAVAAKCIKFLKENKFGRATFLPLNKLKDRSADADAKSVLKHKGVEGLAIELVSFDPQYQRVFSYVFESTVVVGSIEDARAIGIGKCRMVTLDGDLLESSGAMHGGFRERKQQSAFREKELTEDIEKASAEIDRLESQLHSDEKRRQDNDAAITQLREKKAELEGDIIKMERGLHLDDSDLEASKAFKSQLGKELEVLSKRLAEVEDDVREKSICLAQIKTKRQQIRDRMAQLKNPVLLAELNAFEQKKQQSRERILKQDSEIRTFDVQVSTILAPEIESIDRLMKDQQKEIEGFERELEQLAELVKKESAELEKKEELQKELFAKFRDLFVTRSKLNEEVSKIDAQVSINDDRARTEEYKANTLQLERAKFKAELAVLTEEFVQYEGVSLHLDKPEEEMKREIKQFERMQGDLGNVNMRALEIYDAVEREFRSLQEKKDVLSKEKEEVVNLINEIEGKKTELFMRTFSTIDRKFREIFAQLSTKGSEAFIELENPEKPLEGGLSIRVKITGEKFLDIRSLSGGEKTMTALAFIFAIQEYEPATFYVFDEVDAALDKHNSEKFAVLIQKHAHKAQYVIISHNDSVISHADTLYGVSMNEHGMSSVVSLKI